jgi:hypothetical protein
MSRDRARVRFKSTLDPGLLLAAKGAAGGVVTKSNGKGKARAGGDGDNNSRSRAGKPMARVNSLILSTDSPTLTRVQDQPAASNTDERSTIISTIGSFGSSSNVTPPMDSARVGREREEQRGLGTRGKRRLAEQDKASPDVGKRKRAERQRSIPSEDAVLMPDPSIFELPSKGADSADEEWNKIWQRWNTQRDTVRSREDQSRKTMKTFGGLQDVIQEAEKGLSSSQHSLLSIHSEDGQYGTTWSIHEQLYPEAGVVEGLVQDEMSIEDPDDSRSRMDEGLLLDIEFDPNIEEEEEYERVQHHLDMLCDMEANQMQRVRHIIFKGDDVQGEAIARSDESLHYADSIEQPTSLPPGTAFS